MIRRFLCRRSKRKNNKQDGFENELQETSGDTDRLVKSDDDTLQEFDDLSFIVDYIGSDYVSEAQSVPLLMETLKRIKKQHSKPIRVDINLKSGIFKVTDNEQGALLITAPLYAIALCAQEQLRGFETTFALNITRRRIHMCHVFQAGSYLEAASIVRSIALSFRSVAKDLKEKRYEHFERLRSDSEGSTKNYRIRTESDASKEFDALARRHVTKVSGLPTLPSEENVSKISENEEAPVQIVPVMVHTSNLSTDSASERFTSEDESQGEDKRFSDAEEVDDKGCGFGTNDLFARAIQAMESNDLKGIQKCFEDGLMVDAIDDKHLSLLHYAVFKNKVDVTEFLLERDADVNIEGQKDQTPLHYAAAQGNRAMTKLLLAYGANVRAKDCQFRTPLHLCAGCLHNLEVSYVLVEHGARIEDNDIEGVRPVDLHWELREMQNRLIQSATEAFGAMDITRSRSNSGCSSNSGSFKSATRSPSITRHAHSRLFRTSSLRLKASTSLHSIQDSETSSSQIPGDYAKNTSPQKYYKPFEKRQIIPNADKEQFNDFLSDQSKLSPVSINTDLLSDQVLSGYSTREESTDSDFESRKGSVFSDDSSYPAESDEDSVKHMREIIDQKTLLPSRVTTPASYAKLFKKDPATDALHLLATLSQNVECQSTLLANLCLPKPSSQLVSLAHSMNSTNTNLQQISKLLHNLFSVGGPAGRQKCITTGLLKTVIDLLDATEPVQSTCLSILNDLLQTESERDYSGTISGIPIEPLLTIIKSIDNSEAESVIEKTKVKLTKSIDSGYPTSPAVERTASLKKRLDERDSESMKSYSWGRTKTLNRSEYLLSSTFDGVGRGRSESFGSSSDAGRESSPLSVRRRGARHSESDNREQSSVTVPKTRRYSRGSSSSVEGQASFVKTPNTSVVARHVAMKMLAASSRNAKLQEQLAKPRILQLLLDCLDDSDEEIVLQSTATIANIAMNVETHMQLEIENVADGLLKLLKHSNPRVQYQTARGLVYLGHDVDGIYIFNYLPDEDSSPTVIFTEEGGKSHIRGTTVENLVLTLTKDIHLLWGGSNVVPPSPNERKSNTRGGKLRSRMAPCEEQIMNFILTTFQTFIHPIIFMRLLLHRFREPDIYKNFKSAQDDTTNPPNMEHYAPLPILHARLMRIWITWLEKYPEDFVTYPTLESELTCLIPPMKLLDGPYGPCASRLECLLSKVKDESDHSSLYHIESDSHHDVLYEQCSKAITDGRLPCSEDYYTFLAGLKLYIEDICDFGQDFPERLQLSSCLQSINSARLKSSIGTNVSTKQFSKKIRGHYETLFVKQPTQRNVKHTYVDCCQGMEGYGCKFYKVRQAIPSSRSRKKVYIWRHLGVCLKRVVVLDERSKVCVEKFNFKDLNRWEPLDEILTLKLLFKAKNNEKTLAFQSEKFSSFKELSNLILTCTMEIKLQGFNHIDTNPWSRLAEQCGTWGNMALQLHMNKKKNDDDLSPVAGMTSTSTPINKDSRNSSAQCTGPSEFSQSTPVKQSSSWNTSEALSFFNLRRLRSRGDAVSNISHSPSDGGTPPTEIACGEPACSFSRRKSSGGDSRLVLRRGTSTLFNITASEKASLLEESGGDRPGDQSPTDYVSYSSSGKILTCHCPPDADLPNLNLREFSAFELLDHPRELARQITLIDHALFCNITSLDVLLKISLGLIKKHQLKEAQLSVEKVAERFNKMSNWIVYSIVSERSIHRRAKMFMNFIETAKQCLELRNYNAVMAIVVASLGSAHVRRLSDTKELIPPGHLSCLSKMESLMDSKGNYKKYRQTLRTSPTPAVPYFGIYLKDLTFISDGNPDYLKGGIINLTKRRQVFMLLEGIHRFQRKRYNFQEVSEIKTYLLSKPLVSEDQLHQISKEHEPTITTRQNPPVHSNYTDRRYSISFLQNASNRMSSRRQQKSGTPE